MMAETTTTLPLGERIGRNCLIKSMVNLKLMSRVLVAVSREGLVRPWSIPKPALATTLSKKMPSF